MLFQTASDTSKQFVRFSQVFRWSSEMTEFRYRTEDFRTSEVEDFFVPSTEDDGIVKRLCGREAILLVGSRGVGKSFLMRVAEARMTARFQEQRVLPVYVSFSRSTLLQAGNQLDFRSWMLAQICSKIARALAKHGIYAPASGLRVLTGGSDLESLTPLEQLVEHLENAWRSSTSASNPQSLAAVPDVEEFKEVINDLCDSSELGRINVLIDEAAHVLVPDQQRQFFTLMRDLRTPFCAVKAAVYPGTTSYGDSFEPTHDATTIALDRDPTRSSYVEQMRAIVRLQDQEIVKVIDRNKQHFTTLAMAASGNPRTLLKTLARVPQLRSSQLTDLIREFYREEVWSEHSNLAARYPGHRTLIDWGREFLERTVIPGLVERNARASEKSAFFWIHRDAPASVKEAMRLLAYSGLAHENASSIRATRRELGTRYMVNLGCLLAGESDPLAASATLVRDLSVKRMLEFGKNHPAFSEISKVDVDKFSNPSADALRSRLDATIDKLDLSLFQQDRLKVGGFQTIGAVLAATEGDLQRIDNVGPARSRQMMNAAQAAVLEYLSG